MSRPTTTAPPLKKRGRRKMSERQRGLQRLEISRKAIWLFTQQGVHETSSAQIAEAAGLSSRTLWRYFRSKESCVEPVLSLTTDAFADTLRRWPAGIPLKDHLLSNHRPSVSVSDRDATLAVVALSRFEPALRAIWLVVFERAEAVLAEVIAARLGSEPGELAIRVQAATLAAALRLTTESVAERRDQSHLEDFAGLCEAVRAATHGVLGDL